eukprot:GFKZ01010953.1.p1 GENE.GFKZ01010953.1~~GFKZ01010953.1.p1  ORF type:complete len:115 (+),score=0.09 GFKZ01010953.1:221-565(+)
MLADWRLSSTTHKYCDSRIFPPTINENITLFTTTNRLNLPPVRSLQSVCYSTHKVNAHKCNDISILSVFYLFLNFDFDLDAFREMKQEIVIARFRREAVIFRCVRPSMHNEDVG